jgi:hypothetical protein
VIAILTSCFHIACSACLLRAYRSESASEGNQRLRFPANLSPSSTASSSALFETTTIAFARREGIANRGCLRTDIAVPANAEPVIASYVKDGWVFVATKVRRDKPDNETSTPHPLSFTFKTDKPVYPMRLTGVDNEPLSVELYVFGPDRVQKRRTFKSRTLHTAELS